jgi:hypothetical protein
VDLSHITDLRTFTAGLHLQYSSPNTIKSLLQPVRSSIRDVVFTASARRRRNNDEQEDWMDLEELDRFFCQPQCRHLQSITFRLYDFDKYEDIEGMIKLNMATCLSRGILSIMKQ